LITHCRNYVQLLWYYTLLSIYGQLMCLKWHYGMPIHGEKVSLLAPG